MRDPAKLTPAPHHVGAFGEGLVAFARARDRWWVARVDTIGADLIAERDGKRIAISVKTRRFPKDSQESRMVPISDQDVAKLREFSSRFGFEPWWAQVLCLEDTCEVHLLQFPISYVEKLPKTRIGASLRFSPKQIGAHALDFSVSHTIWREQAAPQTTGSPTRG